MRVTIFDRIAANPPQIKNNQILIVAALLGSGMVTIAFVFLNIQISSIHGRINQIQNRSVAVQVGKNHELVRSELLTPEENAEEFVREALPALFAWSKRVTQEIDPSGLDPGRQTQYGTLPTLIFVYSHALTDPYRSVFLKNVEPIFKPERFEQGEATLLRIDRITQPEKTDEGWKVMVYADLITLDTNDQPYLSEPFNNTVYLKNVLPPKRNTAFTPIEQIFAEVRSRGLMITRLSKYEGQ